MTLLAWAGAAQADVFAAGSGDERFTLTCEGTVVVDTPCKVQVGAGAPGDAMPVRFTNNPTRYAHLLKAGIDRAVEGKVPFRLAASDVSLVRGLALDKCHPDAEYYGDILQLCIPAGSTSTVVLFMRGVCDRCNFEPVVLRKQR